MDLVAGLALGFFRQLPQKNARQTSRNAAFLGPNPRYLEGGARSSGQGRALVRP